MTVYKLFPIHWLAAVVSVPALWVDPLAPRRERMEGRIHILAVTVTVAVTATASRMFGFFTALEGRQFIVVVAARRGRRIGFGRSRGGPSRHHPRIAAP